MSSRKLNPASTTEGHPQPYRKKYGKNLHKIHSQLSATAPPPPIASLSFHHANSSSSKKSSLTGGSSGSGGLLLLSTKKGNLDRKGGDPSVGTLSTSAKGVGVSKSSAATGQRQSTHDALLSVLNGEKEGKKEFVPLAWGMKAPSPSSKGQDKGQDKGQEHVPEGQGQQHSGSHAREHTAPSDSQMQSHSQAQSQSGNASSSPQRRIHQGGTTTTTTTSRGDFHNPTSEDHNDIPYADARQRERERERTSANGAHVHEYTRYSNNTSQSTTGGIKSASLSPNRSNAPEPSSISSAAASPVVEEPHKTIEPPKEDQVEFMKKLAKDRAEKRRLEEEMRVLAQKERAALRLKELEMKMKQKEASTPVPPPPPQPPKSLYDPDRPYSSLLGGGGGKNANKKSVNIGSTSISNTPLNRASNFDADHTGPSDSVSSPSTSQINYDDRGSRSNAGPRMLFDPKSGSMIAAPGSRDKKSSKKKTTRSNSSSGNGNEIRNANAMTNGNSNVAPNDKSREDDFGIEVEDEDMTGSRRKNSRYRQREEKRKAKRREENTNATYSKARKGNSATKGEDQSAKRGRILPRTCGVLYVKDAKGHLVSADGCEGDQGYGAHSVPGGRIRNPSGYSAFKRKGRMTAKQSRKNGNTIVDADAGDMPDNFNHNSHHSHPHSNLATHGDFDYTRGLNRSHFMRKNQQQELGGVTSEIGVGVSSSLLDVVTGDEKLDLLSGLDESPKLQATAAAWAPSEAVLALAAANAKKTDVVAVKDSDSHDEVSDSGVHALRAMTLIDGESGGRDGTEKVDNVEASPSIGLGLGFDPSKNMDSLMMSPAMESEPAEVIPDLPTFALKHSSSMSKISSNPFASANGLLGSSTWGTANNSSNMGSLSNWDLIGGQTSDQGNDIQKTDSSSTFLSLGVGGNQTTWGSNTFTGFNGIDNPSVGNSD